MLWLYLSLVKNFVTPVLFLGVLHGSNKRFFFLWEKKLFLMQNIFIVPAMQHGCRAKPLLSPTLSRNLKKGVGT